MSAVIINHPGRQVMPDDNHPPKTIDFDVPPLGSLLSYRVVHALCTVIRDSPKGLLSEQKGKLRATHYAICLAGGRTPIWGVWTINGKFMRFYGRKSAVAEGYPKLVWRTKQSTWTMVDVHDKDHSERAAELRRVYKANQTITGEEVQKLLK